MSRYEGLPDVLRPAEVSRMLRIHVGTLRRRDKEDKLRPLARSEGGHRRYARADVLALLGEKGPWDEKTAAVYARVSTAKQADAGNLERQRLRLLEYVAVNGYRVVLQASDGTSGLNARRRGLHRIVEVARRHEMRFLLVEYPDRLARFGFPYLETLFEVLSVRIVDISNQEPEDAQTELVKDMLSVVFRKVVRDAGRAQGAGGSQSCFEGNGGERRWRIGG
jgi:predicted site-specific integrase-resolvase